MKILKENLKAEITELQHKYHGKLVSAEEFEEIKKSEVVSHTELLAENNVRWFSVVFYNNEDMDVYTRKERA